MREVPWVSSAAIIRDHFIGNGKCANSPILQIVQLQARINEDPVPFWNALQKKIKDY
jgi:hypothetical protein